MASGWGTIAKLSFALGLVLGVHLLPLAVADPGAVLESPEPARASGRADAHAPAGALRLRAELPGEGGGSLHEVPIFAQGRVMHVTWMTVVVRAVSTPAGDIFLEPEHEARVWTLHDDGVRVRSIHPEFDLMAHPSPGAEATFSLSGAAASLPLHRQMESLDWAHGADGPFPFFHHHHVVSGAAPFDFDALGDAQFRASGSFTLFVTGAFVEVGREARELDLRFRSTTSGVPVSDGSLQRVDEYEFLVIQVEDGTLEAQSAPALQGEAMLHDPWIDLEGTLRVADASGGASLGDREVRSRGNDLELTGRMSLVLMPLEPGGSHGYRVSGEFMDVRLDRHPVAPEGLPRLAATTVAGLALAVVLRGLLQGGAWGLFTRLARPEILNHDERRSIMDAIGRTPGLHLRELQRQRDCGWGKLRYHLTVLVRAGQITLERSGKIVRVFPAGVGDVARREALSARGYAADIFALVPEAGGVTQAEIQGALGISRQLISHHILALQRDGLVREVGEHPKRYLRASSS